jgi:hypothetical protein
MMATSGFRDAAVGRTEFPLASVMANLRFRFNTSAISRPVNGVLSATSTRILPSPFFVNDLVRAIMTSSAWHRYRPYSRTICEWPHLCAGMALLCFEQSVCHMHA